MKKQGLSKYKAESSKDGIRFEYVCYVARHGDYEERIYWQPDFDVKASSLAELKALLP